MAGLVLALVAVAAVVWAVKQADQPSRPNPVGSTGPSDQPSSTREPSQPVPATSRQEPDYSRSPTIRHSPTYSWTPAPTYTTHSTVPTGEPTGGGTTKEPTGGSTGGTTKAPGGGPTTAPAGGRVAPTG